jgi:ribonuclease HII
MSHPDFAAELPDLSVAEVRARFEDRDPTRAELAALKADTRAGVLAIVARVENARRKEAAETRKLHAKQKFERELWAQGLTLVAGCDEAGVSPLAGPVVAGAVILRAEDRIRGVDDSKTLDPETRARLAVEIRARAVCWAVGVVGPEEIDALNIYRGSLLAMRRALEGLSSRPEHVLLDARRVPEFAVPQTPIIKGDLLSHSIGAASILAKTHRDGLMVALDAEYPGYGFAAHKGYPVPAHFESLKRLGPCAIHRRSFAPVREATPGFVKQGDFFGGK